MHHVFQFLVNEIFERFFFIFIFFLFLPTFLDFSPSNKFLYIIEFIPYFVELNVTNSFEKPLFPLFHLITANFPHVIEIYVPILMFIIKGIVVFGEQFSPLRNITLSLFAKKFVKFLTYILREPLISVNTTKMSCPRQFVTPLKPCPCFTFYDMFNAINGSFALM